MNTKPIITCAVTGAGDTTGRSHLVPVTPEQIATACLEAADAGAAIVHAHVRNPDTGKGSRDVNLYTELMDRIREKNEDVIVNLTAGMGGDLMLGAAESPMDFGEGTDVVGPLTRLAHVEALLPDICTMDCGSLNFGEGNYVYISTPDMIRAGINRVNELGVRVELEVFDTGNLWFCRQLEKEGLLKNPLWQICHGIPYGAPTDPLHLLAMANHLPADAVWTTFALGRHQLPWVGMAINLGAHIRVGLEDNLYLKKGVLATNPQLVERAVTIAEAMGCEVQTPLQARETLNMPKRA